MKPADFLRTVITPGAAWLEAMTGTASPPAARRFLLAVAMQESGLTHRAQVLAGGAPGPARSFWQFEQGGIQTVPAKGNPWGILAHAASRPRLLVMCDAAEVAPTAAAIWRAIEGHDALAYVCARLLLLTDPKPLPDTEGEGWACYADRTWRPGKPHRDVWSANWAAAGDALAA